MFGRVARGQAIVEFALAATVFFVLFIGIVDFGRALFAYNELGQLARVTTRYAIVNTPPPPSDCTTAGATCQTRITNFLATKVSGLDATKLTTTVAFGGTPTGNTIPGGGLFACTVSPSQGCWIEVQLQYQFAFVALPFISPTLTSSSRLVISSQHP